MPRIAILDDEVNVGNSLRLILEHEGYAVTVCRSLAELRAHPDVRRADAYLLDLLLPEGNCIEALRWLRQNDCLGGAIMISGHGAISDAAEATRAGAFDFL